MDKSEKRRGKYSSAPANSLIAKYRNAGDNETENCQKCRQSNEVTSVALLERNDRRQSSLPIEPNSSFYYSADPYRQRKHHGVSSASRIKSLVTTVPEESYRTDAKALRALRNRFWPQNVAIVRKNRYKDHPDEEDEPKFVDDDLELTGDDNAEDETRGEVVDENCENASEFCNDKEYDGPEVDDVIDEESDAMLERQVDRRLRAQRKTRTEPLPRGHQRMTAVDPSPHYRGQKIVTHNHHLARRCRTATNRDAAQDTPPEDVEDEEEISEPEPPPPRKSMWRCSAPRQDRETWSQSKNLMERYAELNGSSLGSVLQSRRPRITRPEPEASMRSSQLETVRNRKCNRCAASSGHAPKTTSSRNATCRLQDSRYFVREQNGDEGEVYEDSEPPMIYHAKPRKFKEPKSPIYDPREEGRSFDAEIGAIYKPQRLKNSREATSSHRERTKPSVRVNNRHDSSSAALKHENRYWES